jgi:hypothetical protein
VKICINVINQMNTLPNNESADNTEPQPKHKENTPTPSEFLDSILDWLRHWWDAPREKSKAADWAIAVLTVVIAIAAFWSAFIFQGQLAIARDTLVIGQRPWLGIDSKPTVEVEGNRWKVVFRVKNYGVSPALHSAFASETDNAPIVFDVSKAKIEWACSRGKALTADPAGHGYTIFPGSSQPQDITIDGTSQTALYLLGCLTYLDQFGASHRTRFCEAASAPVREGAELTQCFGGEEAD